jgi:hypothetical protein
MEDYLALVSLEMDYLRTLSKAINETPMSADTKRKHCECRKRYVDTLLVVGKLLTLCQDEIKHQTERITRHIAELEQ